MSGPFEEHSPDRSEWMGTEEQRQARRQRKAPNGQQPKPGNGAADETLAPEPWVHRDPAMIPPREWLLGTTLLRGYATVLGSTGGTGKTSWAIAASLAVITGRDDILGLHVFQRGKVWLLTLEDDRVELERRIAAAMIVHGVHPDEITGRLFVNAMDGKRPLVLARADEIGRYKICDDAVALEEGIRTLGVALSAIDPLVKSHKLVENSNEHMDQLQALTNGIASRTNSALLLPAHTRKGNGEDGARDAIRGGGALIDGARIVRTLTAMTAQEAEGFGLPPGEARRFVRMTDAKANMAPKEDATWFELASVGLGNGAVNPTYPNGDNVQAAKAWTPPAGSSMDRDTLARVFARLREEPEPGWFYSPDPRAKFPAAMILIDVAGQNRKQATAQVKRWMADGVLSQAGYWTPNRNMAVRIVLNEPRIAEILAPPPTFEWPD